jgi:hypothetical protein
VSEAKPPTWFIATTLFMLLISGAWTIASATSALRAYSLTAITVGNLGFLLALLSSALGYATGEARPVWKRIMIYSFAFGVVFLMASIVIFSVALLSRPAFATILD